MIERQVERIRSSRTRRSRRTSPRRSTRRMDVHPGPRPPIRHWPRAAAGAQRRRWRRAPRCRRASGPLEGGGAAAAARGPRRRTGGSARPPWRTGRRRFRGRRVSESDRLLARRVLAHPPFARPPPFELPPPLGTSTVSATVPAPAAGTVDEGDGSGRGRRRRMRRRYVSRRRSAVRRAAVTGSPTTPPMSPLPTCVVERRSRTGPRSIPDGPGTVEAPPEVRVAARSSRSRWRRRRPAAAHGTSAPNPSR